MNSQLYATNVFNLTYPCDDSPQCHPLSRVILPGTYKFEVWGGQGGNSSVGENNGGRGGYAFGIINFTKKTNIYIYIGAKGSFIDDHEAETYNSFNGGGKGFYVDDGELRFGTDGGGATDIRVNGQDLTNRIIIAGGGGGGGYYSQVHKKGGYGGGYKGGVGESSLFYDPGEPGDQEHGGQVEGKGDLGEGGNHTVGYAGAGGGGGYYGGGSGGGAGSGGGGGSGFICKSKECEYPFISGELRAGNEEIPDFYTGGPIIGNYGNGFVRITKYIPYVCPIATKACQKREMYVYIMIFNLLK